MEGLYKVLLWRVNGTITNEEFNQIYLEWLKKRDLLKTPANSKSYYWQTDFFFLVELLKDL
jgi:hypothetical protein